VPVIHHPGRRRCLVLLPGLVLAAAGPDELLARSAPLPIPLADTAPEGLSPVGYLVSEKYDGVRALWDGSRLRFRSGGTIHAPASFLDRLPPVALDGELWLGRGRFEDLSAAVRRAVPREGEWQQIRYMVFDLPAAPGVLVERISRLQALPGASGPGGWQPVAQQRLADHAALARRLDDVLSAGGEGLMLRRADAPYQAGRSPAMLKLKPVQDAEAVVLAHEPGRGRHAGRLGALRVRDDDGRVFRLGTGFSDAQRDVPPPIGSRVSYSYRGRTDDGVPRFASFLRPRPEGL
jgi:DNA ligase-1